KYLRPKGRKCIGSSGAPRRRCGVKFLAHYFLLFCLSKRFSLLSSSASCEYTGQVYGIGESWITSDCYQCVCLEPFGVGCCDLATKPVDYPEWCEVIRKPDSCTSVAVMRVNHKLPCLWGQGPDTVPIPVKFDNPLSPLSTCSNDTVQ
uniref:Si:ch1073-70f20.1 n=1 Tax=Poecilia reticulata TaxID=8081 RepID=A0A3P9PRJ5_POERE